MLSCHLIYLLYSINFFNEDHIENKYTLVSFYVLPSVLLDLYNSFSERLLVYSILLNKLVEITSSMRRTEPTTGFLDKYIFGTLAHTILQ